MAYLQTKALGFLQIMRPVHWVKNLSLFAALVFSGLLTERELLVRVVWAFIVFNIATSSTYAFNDSLDANRDKLHPLKKNRPIPSGKLSVAEAVLLALALAAVATLLAYSLSQLFAVFVLGYLFLQMAYSLYLKNLHIIDILIIASGFVIRVYAGAFVINAHLSVWFLLCVISIALFLASGKRRAELGVMGSRGGTRKSLSRYSPELLNSYVTMFGNAAWMSWALFTFFESPRASLPLWLFLAELSRAATINKLLMITIPLAIFGIMRYEALIFEERSEAPEKLLLTDVSLVTAVVLWILVVVWILYGGVATHAMTV